MKSRFTTDSLILILFILLSILATYPTAARLSDFTVMATDSLLQAWTLEWDADYLMHAQTIHGKPLVGGWLAPLPQNKAKCLNQGSVEKAVTYLLLGEQASCITNSGTMQAALNESLVRHNVRYIIDHDRVLGNWIEQALGWRARHKEKVGDHLTVYEPPAE